MVKSFLAMGETGVPSLGWKDLLEKEMAIHSSSCLESPMDKGACGVTIHGVAESQTQLSASQFHFHLISYWNKETLNIIFSK